MSCFHWEEPEDLFKNIQERWGRADLLNSLLDHYLVERIQKANVESWLAERACFHNGMFEYPVQRWKKASHRGSVLEDGKTGKPKSRWKWTQYSSNRLKCLKYFHMLHFLKKIGSTYHMRVGTWRPVRTSVVGKGRKLFKIQFMLREKTFVKLNEF